jgi:hypothetical protein
MTTDKLNPSVRCPLFSSRRTVLRGWLAEQSRENREEAESNTSTVALRVVGGDEKGSIESERVKYGRKSHGTRTLE